MTTLKVCNYIVALLTLIIGGSIAWTSYGYGIEMTVFGPGPGFWPFILAVGLIVVAFLIVFDTVKHQNDYGKEQIVLAAAENFSVYKMMALTGGYLVLIYLTGFYVATFLFMCAAMKLLGAKRLATMLTASLVFLAVIYVVFGMLLHITMPVSIFME